MKAQLRNHVAALFLLAPAAVTLTALPSTVAAQPATPEVQSLQVTSDHGLAPGARLQFRLEGTPRAKASIRIPGAQAMIPLAETSRGVYSGRYVIARNDRIREGDKIRAIMRRGNHTITASYDLPAGIGNVASAPPLRIERFQADALDRIEPGTEIRFTVMGAPGATAFVDLPGVPNNVALREVRPGQYEGSYVVRRRDTLDPNGRVVATLRMGDRAVAMNLAQPLVAADNRPPAITRLTPREGETVAGPAAVISGSFRDRGGAGVDPNSVRIRLSGRDVTSDAQVTPDSFTYRAPLPPGRHTVDVVARDGAGNTVRRTWSFEVASGPAQVPIQILSHVNNGQVEGNVTRIRGRTAPMAEVNVRVDAVPPIVGQFGVAQNVFSRTLQADQNGDFEFSFNSPFPVAGTRYDVAMKAQKADVTTEAKLVLFQRQG
jgi:hypothetical protein